MANKKEPIITHTEILCFAIRHLESEIEDIKLRGQNLRKEVADGLVPALIAPLTPKLEALKLLYRVETGTEYV